MNIDYSGWYRLELKLTEDGVNNGVTVFYCRTIDDLIAFSTACVSYIPQDTDDWFHCEFHDYLSEFKRIPMNKLDKIHIYQYKERCKPSTLPINMLFEWHTRPFILHIYQPGTHGLHDVHNTDENLNIIPVFPDPDDTTLCLALELLLRLYYLCKLFCGQSEHCEAYLYELLLEGITYHTRNGVKKFPLYLKEDRDYQRATDKPFHEYCTLLQLVNSNNLKYHISKPRFLPILKQFIEDYN